jgi:hypothetical protein
MGIERIKLGPKSALLDRAASGLLEAARKVPEKAGRVGDQPLPDVGQKSVFAAIRTFLDEREATGIRRYGRSLETFNSRDAFRDLLEELADGMLYAQQARMEHQAVVEALLELYRAWRGFPGQGLNEALMLAGKLEEHHR